MSIRNFSLAVAIAVAGATPGFAASKAPSPARQANTTTASAPAAPNRAAVVRNIDANFKAIDTNGDGTLSVAELAAAAGKGQQQRLAKLRARFEADFAKLDTNKDGQLSKAEFMAAAPQVSATTPTGANLLAQLDKNKDGKVSADEFRMPVLERFDAIDTNHDGIISPAEREAAQARATKR